MSIAELEAEARGALDAAMRHLAHLPQRARFRRMLARRRVRRWLWANAELDVVLAEMGLRPSDGQPPTVSLVLDTDSDAA